MNKRFFLAAALSLALSGQVLAEDLELGKTYQFEQAAGSYDDIYADFTYEATEDGVLVFKSDASLSGFVCVDDGDETSINFSTTDYTNYYYKAQVKAGSTYDFTFKTWKSYSVSAELTHPVAGSEYDIAIQVKAGQQTLAAEAGTTWYLITPGKDGVLHVSSDAALPGGKVSIIEQSYGGTPSSWTYVEGAEGVFDVSMEISTYSSYFVKIVKATATEQAQTFTIAVEDSPEGYSDSNPIMISELPYSGSAPVGTTYYGLEVTSEMAGQLLSMAATGALMNEFSNCSLYPKSNSYDQTYGDASVEAVVQEDTYILKWVNYETSPIAFTVGMKTLLEGQTIDSPLAAQVGDNDFKAAGTWFYKYTAAKTGKLSITPSDASISVKFPRGTGAYDGEYTFSKNADTYAIPVTEGEEYLIKFEFATEESWFTLAEGEFEKGETRDNPIEVVNGDYTFGSAQAIWISYTADKDGKLTIASDAVASYSNKMEYYTAGATYGESVSSYDDNYDMIYSKSLMVKAGDVILVNAVMANNEAGKHITFTIAEPADGETFAKPLVAVLNETYNMPSIGYGSPYWVKLQLTPGTYRFYASDYISGYYYDSAEKATTDAESYSDALSLSNQDEETGDSYFKFVIEESKDVYFKLTRSWGAFKIQFTKEDIHTGINSIELSDDAAVYDLQGRKVTKLVPGTIYVKNGKKMLMK